MITGVRLCFLIDVWQILGKCWVDIGWIRCKNLMFHVKHWVFDIFRDKKRRILLKCIGPSDVYIGQYGTCLTIFNRVKEARVRLLREVLNRLRDE